MTVKRDLTETLVRTPASDIKKVGWRGVMKSVNREGQVLVTNHDSPEAVILSVETYTALANALRAAEAQQEQKLAALRRRFDQRLASLESDDAGERLREVLREPATLDGAIKAGESH